MQAHKFSLRRRIKSFRFACSGLYQFFVTQHNAILHAIATMIVMILSLALPLSVTELLFITVAIAMVWTAELFNTVIEKLCDVVCPKRNSTIKFIKDVSAAAVLVTAIMALVIGSLVFIPKLV